MHHHGSLISRLSAKRPSARIPSYLLHLKPRKRGLRNFGTMGIPNAPNLLALTAGVRETRVMPSRAFPARMIKVTPTACARRKLQTEGFAVMRRREGIGRGIEKGRRGQGARDKGRGGEGAPSALFYRRTRDLEVRPRGRD